MQTWEVLAAAADKIERDGWRAGSYGFRCEPTCVVGAIAWVGGGQFEFKPAAERALAAAIGTDIIEDWNDARGRTEAEVTSTLRACAASEKARAARASLPVVVLPVVVEHAHA